MTYDELLEFARRRPGLTLKTVTGRPFRVAVYLDSLVFVPESTTLGRSEGRKAHERFLARYLEIGSMRPGDYRGISRDASYLVPLVQAARSSREPEPGRAA
jgi:hypothetical protein